MQAVFGTDIVALTTEYALTNPDPDSFSIREELNRIGRTDSDTHFTPDTGVPVIEDFPPEPWRSLHWRMNGCSASGYRFKEISY